MNEPWGISGPEFLLCFGLALAALLVLRIAGPPLLSRRRPLGASADDGSPPQDVHELAYLAGGADRAVDTAIAKLLESHRLRVNSSGRITSAGKTPKAPGLERSVHLAAKGSGATTAQVRKSTHVAPALRAIESNLKRRGLLSTGDGAGGLCKGIAVAYAAVLVIGIVRLVNGAELHRPVGGLIGLLLLALVLTIITFATRNGGKRRRPTTAGYAMVERARAEAKSIEEGDDAIMANSGRTFQYASAAGIVALAGIAFYPDDELSTALLSAPISSGWSSGASGGGSSSSGGSSCSSGSSCGGGGSSCGGGGGCGG